MGGLFASPYSTRVIGLFVKARFPRGVAAPSISMAGRDAPDLVQYPFPLEDWLGKLPGTRNIRTSMAVQRAWQRTR